ncbi:MAG: thiamine-phosphate kinase [Desulfobacterales bacterium]|nr:thiamine-phosphate kinase [Desulfobacterales bacterium]
MGTLERNRPAMPEERKDPGPDRPSERELIARIRAMSGSVADDLVCGIGDDCAVIRTDDGDRLVRLLTTDSLADGVHFDRRWHPPFLLGRKAAAVNISDVAAMGGRPRFALLAMAVAPDLTGQWLESFLQGFVACLTEHDALLVGGDTVSCRRGAVITVTMVGEVEAGRVLFRNGARVDDSIWVTGPLGGAAAGLELCRQEGEGISTAQWTDLVQAHLNPEPQVRIGSLLAASGKVRSMMDLSDGLATDLAHLCAASRVGAEIDEKLLPGPGTLAAAAERLHLSALDWMISGGEDYQLLFTAAAEHDQTLLRLVRQAVGREIHRIGRVVETPGVILRTAGAGRRIDYQGYDHFQDR